MLCVHTTFSSFSPNGNFITVNGNFHGTPRLMILKFDGSKQWTLQKESGVFYMAWSPAEEGVIHISIGPIFESSKVTVQIARISFKPSDLTDDREAPVVVKMLTRSNTGNNAFPSCLPDRKSPVFWSARSGH